jgi:hypothetical protein
MFNSRIIQIAWLAGLLEGEGCFSLANKGGHSINIQLSTTDRDTVERAASIMRTRLHQGRTLPSGKTVWRCYVAGAAAAALMRRLLPFMGSRRTSRIQWLLNAHDKKLTRKESGGWQVLKDLRKKGRTSRG